LRQRRQCSCAYARTSETGDSEMKRLHVTIRPPVLNTATKPANQPFQTRRLAPSTRSQKSGSKRVANRLCRKSHLRLPAPS
jgi:hypothetical protein